MEESVSLFLFITLPFKYVNEPFEETNLGTYWMLFFLTDNYAVRRQARDCVSELRELHLRKSECFIPQNVAHSPLHCITSQTHSSTHTSAFI